jgi:predicted SprT family Zn-dependent metalloprotease
MLLFKKPKALEDVNVRYPITCYWLSAGTWGAFTPPDKIYICPWKKNGGMYTSEELEHVIFHELYHLYYYRETEDMDFKRREEFINKKMSIDGFN